MTAPNGLPTHFMGICDWCRSIKTFTTAEARDAWEKHHPHQDGYGDGDPA